MKALVVSGMCWNFCPAAGQGTGGMQAPGSLHLIPCPTFPLHVWTSLCAAFTALRDAIKGKWCCREIKKSLHTDGMRWGPCVSMPKLHNLRQINVWWFDLFQIFKPHFGLNLFAPLALIKLLCIFWVYITKPTKQTKHCSCGWMNYSEFPISAFLLFHIILGTKKLAVNICKLLQWGYYSCQDWLKGKGATFWFLSTICLCLEVLVSIKWRIEHPAFIASLDLKQKLFPEFVSDKLLETSVAFEVPG